MIGVPAQNKRGWKPYAPEDALLHCMQIMQMQVVQLMPVVHSLAAAVAVACCRRKLKLRRR